MRRVLFLCIHNSARSQMAEALLRHLDGRSIEAFSAGSDACRIWPETFAVLAETGIDASLQQAKGLEAFEGERFDYAVTLCKEAREACPLFPGAAHHLHWDIDDPADVQGSAEERLAAFRRARDEIRSRIEEAFADG